jgi:hypothetical protein
MIDPETNPEQTDRSDEDTPETDVPDTSGAGYGNHGEADD